MFAHMPIIRDILLAAVKRKASLEVMCRELDIDPSDIYRSDIQVPFEKAYMAWDVAIKHSGDSELGLHMGDQTNPSVMGLVGHLLQSCPNLEESFRKVCEFSALTTDLFTYNIAVSGNRTILSYRACDAWMKVSPETARQALDQSLSGTLGVFNILCGRKIVPLEAHISISKPRHHDEYEKMLQAPIIWKAKVDSLIFSREQLLTPVLSYDESLMGMFSTLVSQRIAQMKTESSFADKVRKEIMTTFQGQLPTIESIAARFNMTVRSFQRKLDEENVSYRKLCNDLGKDFALSLLKNHQIRIGEVASALGYGDPRAFQRAFKTWTGQTPKEYRDAVTES